jgi:hypothetical protein
MDPWKTTENNNNSSNNVYHIGIFRAEKGNLKPLLCKEIEL